MNVETDSTSDSDEFEKVIYLHESTKNGETFTDFD